MPESTTGWQKVPDGHDPAVCSTLEYQTCSPVLNIKLKNKGLQKALEENRVEYELARTLIKIRVDRGLTQSGLAKKVNTKQSVISRMENIQSVPSLTFLKRVANALDSSLEIKFIPR